MMEGRRHLKQRANAAETRAERAEAERKALEAELARALAEIDRLDAGWALERAAHRRLREVVLFAVDLARTSLVPGDGSPVGHDQQVPLVGGEAPGSEDGLDDLVPVVFGRRILNSVAVEDSAEGAGVAPERLRDTA